MKLSIEMCIRDRTRTDLFHPLPDGSTALYYEKSVIREDAKDCLLYTSGPSRTATGYQRLPASGAGKAS